ncbi:MULTISPECIES: hypothetical protein [unclassified Lysobacter]|uniref:hypothetical protein n=1 Tax=unclassified Lysobacter TaxID=2635362 RepID=UPI001C247D71|nr:hypothetical protein [Lysobacter sp. MMG2]MBU8976736.1 hypothetical protein [Lysobacter sp. MMG2]
MSVAVPVLPESEVRAAMHAEHWERAFELLAEHDRELRQALESVDLTKTSAAPWRELLERQTALLHDLSVVRDETAAILARMGRERRGALAYRTLAG